MSLSAPLIQNFLILFQSRRKTFCTVNPVILALIERGRKYFYGLHLIAQAVDVADCSFNFVYISKPQYRKRNGLSMVLKMRQFLKYIVDWNVIVGRK